MTRVRFPAGPFMRQWPSMARHTADTVCIRELYACGFSLRVRESAGSNPAWRILGVSPNQEMALRFGRRKIWVRISARLFLPLWCNGLASETSNLWIWVRIPAGVFWCEWCKGLHGRLWLCWSEFNSRFAPLGQ